MMPNSEENLLLNSTLDFINKSLNAGKISLKELSRLSTDPPKKVLSSSRGNVASALSEMMLNSDQQVRRVTRLGICLALLQNPLITEKIIAVEKLDTSFSNTDGILENLKSGIPPAYLAMLQNANRPQIYLPSPSGLNGSTSNPGRLALNFIHDVLRKKNIEEMILHGLPMSGWTPLEIKELANTIKKSNVKKFGLDHCEVHWFNTKTITKIFESLAESKIESFQWSYSPVSYKNNISIFRSDPPSISQMDDRHFRIMCDNIKISNITSLTLDGIPIHLFNKTKMDMFCDLLQNSKLANVSLNNIGGRFDDASFTAFCNALQNSSITHLNFKDNNKFFEGISDAELARLLSALKKSSVTSVQFDDRIELMILGKKLAELDRLLSEDEVAKLTAQLKAGVENKKYSPQDISQFLLNSSKGKVVFIFDEVLLLLPASSDKIRDLYFDYALYHFDSIVRNTNNPAEALLATLPFFTDANQTPISYTQEQQKILDAFLQQALGKKVLPGANALSQQQRLQDLNDFLLQEFAKTMPIWQANAKTQAEKNILTSVQNKMKLSNFKEKPNSAELVSVIIKALQTGGVVFNEDQPLTPALALRQQWQATDLTNNNRFAKWAEDNKSTLNITKFLAILSSCLDRYQQFQVHKEFDVTLLKLAKIPITIAPLENDERQTLLKQLALNFLAESDQKNGKEALNLEIPAVQSREDIKLQANTIAQRYEAAMEQLEGVVLKKALQPLKNVIKSLDDAQLAANEQKTLPEQHSPTLKK